MKNKISRGLVVLLDKEGKVVKHEVSKLDIPNDLEGFLALKADMDQDEECADYPEPRYIVPWLSALFYLEEEAKAFVIETIDMLMRHRKEGEDGFKGQWIVIANPREMLAGYPTEEDMNEILFMFDTNNGPYEWEGLNEALQSYPFKEGGAA